MANDYRTPGQYIRALLDERAWDQRVLTAVLGVEDAAVSKLLSGRRTVDAPTAIALGEAFGIDPERFLQLQKQYELARARIEVIPDPARAARAQLFGELPIAEMITRGWLDAPGIRDIPKVEAALAKFFGVSAVADIEILPHAAKKTDTATPATPAQLAWIYRVKQIARDMVVAPYSRSALESALASLQHLLLSAEEARKVPRILAECGVRFAIVESLKSAKIDGVCTWLAENSPVIGMSVRFDRIDNFWFVLRHEIEHVLREHGKSAVILDAELEGDRAGTGSSISQEERAANEAAADFCVPAKLIDQFISRKAPLFSKRDMLGFANTIRVHPGIVTGQLQQRTGRYEIFRDQLVKIRTIVTAGAAVDGWGDVYPVTLS